MTDDSTHEPLPQLASDATTDEMADAVAAAIERRNRKPTLQETMREKTRQLLAVKVDHNGRPVS